MEILELLAILKRGEDSRHQFKKNVTNIDALASEMTAFSNGDGGLILIGVNDDGTIEGLDSNDIHRINQLVSNAASQNVSPPINPMTENIDSDNGLVLYVEISSGLNKPYQDKNGVFWVKSGADKRKATSREEIQRLFQSSLLIHADEMPVMGATISDMDMGYFENFYNKRYGESLDDQELSISDILDNMNLQKEGYLNICSVLLFTKTPQFKLPVFIVKAGAFDTVDISTTEYEDSKNIEGKLSDIFRQTVSFILSNIRHIQGDQSINSLGAPEVPRESIEELVANALIHRDYFISAPIRVFVFQDRVEIISPGYLPNKLTVENIKAGNSVARNPVLASFANYLIPYRGYGSGIIRALKKYPHIDFINDRDGNQFKAIIKRRMHNAF
jgi:ATP-dependent DNA helicase RecG